MKEFVDKLIKRLKKGSFAARSADSECNYHSFINLERAIGIVNQLAEEYNQDSTKNNQGWILCSERLPEVFDNVLISTIEGGRTIGHRCPNQAFGRFYDLHSFAIDNVIAWQPLPEPYKPEEKQKKTQPNFYSERFNRVI